MKRLAARAVALAGAVYVALCALFWFVQDGLFFHPDPRPLTDCRAPAGVEIVEYEGERALFTPSNGDGLLIFYHGNAGGACGWRFLGPNHVGPLGFDTLVVEFPGYAGDPRQPSGAAFADLIERTARWAARYDSVVVSGFSLGSGVASLHAAHAPPEAVLLFAPFRDFPELVRSKGGVFPRFLFRTDFDNSALLAESGAPTFIVYGTADAIIPAEMSLALAGDLGAQVAGITEVPGARHNDLIGAVDLEGVLRQTLATARQERQAE
ncbi:MAG: alpha/beta fold hydrolase [Pseudomonadota bacterium]